MTTLLTKSLSREVLLEGEACKVVISPTGLRFNKKGRRQGPELSWNSILALGDLAAHRPKEVAHQPRSDLPEPVAADAAKQIRFAREAITRAAEAISRAGNLPASVLSTLEPDPLYGRIGHHADWFIEPLLTTDELASILRISKRSVSTLGIAFVSIAGEQRYRQSEVRRYLAEREATAHSLKRVFR